MPKCHSCGKVYDHFASYCNDCDIDLVVDLTASDEGANLEDFSEVYLRELRSNLQGFGTFFRVSGALYLAIIVISTIVTLVNEKSLDVGLILYIGPVFIVIIAIAVLSGLCLEFVKLQVKKVENDIHNTIAFRLESVKMAKDILRKAEEKVDNSIVVSGGNAVFAFDGGTVSGVSQSFSVQGDSDLVRALALLVSYCEESENTKAIELATELSKEATKEAPNRGVLFELWSGVTAALPNVASILGIAQGIKKLFM